MDFVAMMNTQLDAADPELPIDRMRVRFDSFDQTVVSPPQSPTSESFRARTPSDGFSDVPSVVTAFDPALIHKAPLEKTIKFIEWAPKK